MLKKMKIALVAPLYVAVPPNGYGGIERDVHYLAQELSTMGHDVTVFCSGDSKTAGTIHASIPKAMGLNPSYFVPVRDHSRQMLDILKEQDRFDIINFHCNHIQYLIENLLRVPYVTTLHIHPLEDSFHKDYCHRHPYIAISETQRSFAPEFNWMGTALNGKPKNLYFPCYNEGKYLAFLGSFVPEKGPHIAIDIAKASGLPLRIGAKIYPDHREYFESKIEPELGKNGIEYLGEINNAEKQDLLAGAKALLFPISWDEPFGLVMIEAMACGTPVIGFNRGAVAEIVRDGQSGFVVANKEAALHALSQLNKLDRRIVRKNFEERFSSERMALSHLTVYHRIISQK
ncbi:MAG: glycosyltransferase family 4 protein [Alphaproteobacteria bacterium]|nr:glycosyltransferase family 4 protein [Alphaproteobacteria bacterium]